MDVDDVLDTCTPEALDYLAHLDAMRTVYPDSKYYKSAWRSSCKMLRLLFGFDEDQISCSLLFRACGRTERINVHDGHGYFS